MDKQEIIARVVQIANAQIGTAETPKGSNKNKYAEFFDALRKQGVNIYNGFKNGASWCDLFADYCYIQATSVEIGPRMIYQPLNGCGAGCSFSAGYYRAHGAFVSEPEVGDQIFFGKKGKTFSENKFEHTGVVVKVTPKMVYTVEGNTSNEVKVKSYQKSAARILGYGRPNWDLAVKAEEDETPTEPAPAPIQNKPAKEPAKPSPSKKVITAPITPKSKNAAYAKTWTVATNEKPLRLRQGPGTNYAKMARISKGTKVTCDGSYTGAWLYITYNSKAIIYKGFVLAKWLK